MSISDGDYNRARAILAAAGSNTAAKSHDKHTKGKGSPEGHGVSLLQEARDEFQANDAGGEDLQAGMTGDHYNAIHSAADQMGITSW